LSTEKSVELPVKRTTGETLKDRMTDNAYERILPARYLRQDENGEMVESQEELFERVAKNVALAEAVYAAENEGEAVLVEPSDVKPNHSNREELVEEVFGEGVTLEDDVKDRTDRGERQQVRVRHGRAEAGGRGTRSRRGET